MIPVSFSVRLHFRVNSSLALSLPQSSPLYPVRLDSFAPSPFSARASAIRSRTCGRQRLAFLAVSATGGARKPNPSEGGKGAPAPTRRFTPVPPQHKKCARMAGTPKLFNIQYSLVYLTYHGEDFLLRGAEALAKGGSVRKPLLHKRAAFF